MNARLGGWFLIAVAMASPCAAQRGGDGYSMRRFYGNDAHVWKSYREKQTLEAKPKALVNPAARQTLPHTPLPDVSTPRQPQLTSGAINAIKFYGGANSQATLARMPQRPRFVPQGGASVGVGAKQFSDVRSRRDPTISPYLNLFREDLDGTLPNYYSLVKPYQQQISANRQQQGRINHLQRQVRQASYQPPATGAGTLPPTGTRARFGDTGQFYSGWNKR